jgi:hypothetical protein
LLTFSPAKAGHYGDAGIVVAVMANIAHANTSELAVEIGNAFAKGTR